MQNIFNILSRRWYDKQKENQSTKKSLKTFS